MRLNIISCLSSICFLSIIIYNTTIINILSEKAECIHYDKYFKYTKYAYNSTQQLYKTHNKINPGLKFSFSNKEINYMKDALINNITNLISNININNIELEKKVPFLGKILLNIENIKFDFTEFKKNNVNLEINANNSHTINLIIKDNANVKIKFDYFFQSGFYVSKTNSKGLLEISNLNFNVLFNINELNLVNNFNYEKGKYLITPNIINIIFNNQFNLNLNLLDNNNLLTNNIFEDFVSKIVKLLSISLYENIISNNDLINRFCNISNTYLNKHFSLIDPLIRIPLNNIHNNIYIDLSSIESIVYQKDKIQFNLLMNIYNNNFRSNISGVELPSYEDNKSILPNDILIYINQNSIFDAINAAYQNNIINISLDYNDFYNKTTNNSLLNTTTFNLLFSDMADKITNEIPMKINCYADEFKPLLDLSYNNSCILIGINCLFYVKDNNKYNYIFNIFFDLNVQFNFFIEKNYIKIKVFDLFAYNIKTNNNNYVKINPYELCFIINNTSPILLNEINKILFDKGIRLPVINNFKLYNTSLKVYNGYIEIKINSQIS